MAYDAFISYSHTADGRLAPAVQSGLHRLARPWYRTRALRVFRDETGLAVNPHLWGSIETALDESEYFVLMASPEAAASPWVAREIEHWCATKPVDRILPVLTDGDLVWDAAAGGFDLARSTALPAVLATAFVVEPRHLDLRWARSETQLDLRHADFRAAIAGLAAPIHGVSRDELEGEDVRQHRRALRLAWGAAALLLFVTIAAVVSASFAVGYASTARANERRALEERTRARRSAGEATRQRTLAIENASTARSAQDEAEANATEAAQNATEAQQQQSLAQQNAAEAEANGQEAQAQSIAAQQSAAEASANAAQAQASADAAARSAADARAAAQLAAAQRSLAERNATQARAQQARAIASATSARARQLAASALNVFGTNPDRSLLMSVQGNRFEPSPQTRDSLMRTLQRQPRALSGYLPTEPVGAVALLRSSPDGRVVGFAGSDGRMGLADPVSGAALPAPPTVVQRLGGFPGFGFSPDGKLLVLQSASTLEIWDVAAGRTVETLTPSFGQVSAAAFGSDNRRLVVVAADGVHAISLRAGPASAAVAATPTIALPPEFVAFQLALSRDGGLLAISGITGLETRAEVRVFDAESGQPVVTLPAEGGSCLCVGQRGTVDLRFEVENGIETLTSVPLAPSDFAVLVWQVGSWERIRTVAAPPSGEWVSAVDEGNDRFATSSGNDGLARIRDAATGALIGAPYEARLEFCAGCGGDGAARDALVFGPAGTLIAAGEDGIVRMFDPNRVDPNLTTTRRLPAGALATWGALSADGRVAAFAVGGSVVVADTKDGRELTRFQASSEVVDRIELSPDGSTLLVEDQVATPGSFASTLELSAWEVPSGRQRWRSATEFGSSFGTTFDPSGRMVAVVGAVSDPVDFFATSLVLIDAATGATLGAPTRLPSGSARPSFSADGGVIAVAVFPFGASHGPVLFDVAQRRIVRELDDPRLRDTLELEFSANGRVAIAPALSNDRVVVLDARTFAVTGEFRTGGEHSIGAAISADGELVAVGTSDRRVQLFATGSGEPVGEPVGGASTQGGLVVITPSDPTVVVLIGGTVTRVDVDPESWVAQACAMAGRNLTRAEWRALLGPDVPYEATCPARPPGR